MNTFINPQHLWKYREFDRSTTPAPSCFGIIQYTLNEITEYLRTHKMEPVELVIIDDKKALLIDGNHRICSAILSGMSLVPVNINHMTQTEANVNFTDHVLKRFVAL